MKLELEEIDSIIVVRPQGNLDKEAVKEFQEKLADFLAKEDPRVVVDLSGASRVTSAALRLFVSLSKQLDSRGGGFTLCGPTGDVARAITVGGLDRLCRVVPELRQALDSLKVDDRLDRLASLVSDLLARAEVRHQAAQAC